MMISYMKKALFLALIALAISSAQGRKLLSSRDVNTESVIELFGSATAHGSSHTSATGAHAEMTSANGAVAYRNIPKFGNTDWSHTNSASWGSSGLGGEIRGMSEAEAKTEASILDVKVTDAYTRSNAHMSNKHYTPSGTANSHFFAKAKTNMADIQVGAGRDVSIVTPHFAGSSASAAAGKSKTDDALIGTFDHIKYYHGGNLPVTAVDVAVQPYVYDSGRK